MNKKDSGSTMNKFRKFLLFVAVVVGYNCLFFGVLQWKSGKYFEPTTSLRANCSEENPCVHFCCDNGNSCVQGDTITAREINATWDFDQTFAIVRGRPCKEMYASDEDEANSYFVLSKVRLNAQKQAIKSELIALIDNELI